MMRITIGYPERADEVRMASQHLEGSSGGRVDAVCKAEDILAIRAKVSKVIMQEKLLEYITDMIRLTREEERYLLGASPRALLALVKAAQAAAYLAERDYCLPDDVKKVAPLVLGHRLVLTPAAKLQKVDPASILKSLIIKTPVPII
jgi:MoxR-like ATPase